MKKILIPALALGFISTAASAEGIIPGVTATIGAERALEAESNSVFGSVALENIEVGATISDTATTDFELEKIEMDTHYEIKGVTLYLENDFDKDFKHAETVIGAKISF